MMHQSLITYPHCGTAKFECMPMDACQFFYDCAGCGPCFTISLKRSTHNLQLSTSCRPITQSLGGGLNRSTQHFILEEEDGVQDIGSDH
jgi:hypothetical protein